MACRVSRDQPDSGGEWQLITFGYRGEVRSNNRPQFHWDSAELMRTDSGPAPWNYQAVTATRMANPSIINMESTDIPENTRPMIPSIFPALAMPLW